MWSDMKRKNRIRGRKAHKTAQLNKALKALKEINDLPSSESLEKFNIKTEKLDFCLTSANKKAFSPIHPYQDEFSYIPAKHEVCPTKGHDSDVLCSNNAPFQEKCVAPQVKIENGYDIKVEVTDETTEEGYDGELNSDGELTDPLKYMTIKLEPPDELPSPESSLSSNSFNVAPDSYLFQSGDGKEADRLLSSNNSAFQIKDMHSSVSEINGMEIEPMNDIPVTSVLAKQQLKVTNSKAGSTVNEISSKSSNNFSNFNSVYHIIKDTDSSLTCKFVKSEILKEEIDYVGKNCIRSDEAKQLEQTPGCIKSEKIDEEYESDSTLPVDDDEEHISENIDNKEEKDNAGKKAYINTLCEGTSLLLEGFGDSNGSSVLSTVEGDFTPYEDYTLAQVNEEALMKRLVFSEPTEEEIFENESNSVGSKPTEGGISSFKEGTVKLESHEVYISRSDINTEPNEKNIDISEQVTINSKCNKQKISEAESVIKKESSEKKVASSVNHYGIMPNLNIMDSETSPDVDILTKEFSINVERIDYTEKSTTYQTKILKDTSCPEVGIIEAKKELFQISSSEDKMKKAKKRNSKGKPKLSIALKKPQSEITELKKSKLVINESKTQSEATKPKKLKLAISEVKKSKLEAIEYEKQKSFEIEQLSAPLYVRPKRRKLSFQEKLDEPQSSVWDSELLPDPSLLSTVGIRKIKQLKIKKKKKSLGLKSKDSTQKELTAGVASAKQRLAKNLSLLSAPVQKFTVEKTEVKNDLKEPKKTQVKNDIKEPKKAQVKNDVKEPKKAQVKNETKESEKCKTDIASDDSINELEQIIDALSAKDEIKSPNNCSLEKKTANDIEEIEIKIEPLETVSVPVINDALLEEILTTGFVNSNSQIYIEPVKPKYRVVTAPPPFPKPSVPFNLDYLVTRIGSWNVAWLEEQTANLEPPPDITYYARNPILSYVCYDEYFDVYYPFLMLEIWQFMFESWQKRIYSSENIIIASVMSHEIEDDVLILQCKATMNDQTPILDFPFEGHLVILNLNLHGCENQAQVFGYVTDHKVEETLPTDCRPSDDMSNNIPVTVFLTIKTKVRMGCPDFEKVIMIEHLCLFKLYVLEFEALVNLHKNELACNILRPQEISYLSKQEKPFLSLGNYSAEQQNTILDLSQLIGSPEPNVSFVSGAPGSGKTHTLVGLVQQLLCEDGNNHNVKLLVTSQTHGGVNDIGCRLVKLQHLFKRSNKRELRLVRVGSFECTHPGLQAHCIDNLVKYNLERNKEELHDTEIRFLAIENDIVKLKSLLMNCRPHSDEIHSAQRKVDKLLLERRQLLKKLSYLKNKMSIDEEERKASMRLEILENADVILTTVWESRSSVLVSAYSGGSTCRFKCCIVDDATQLTELQLLTLLLYDTQKLVLFGDTQQLIPKVKSIASREYGFQLSYFERCQLYFQILSDVPPCNYCVLREQFRMHSDISYFSSSYFYGDKVITPPNVDKHHSFPRLHSCVVFDITDGVQSMDKLNIYNLPEAQFVIKIISELSKCIKCKLNIGIIVSCWGQCDILQKLLTNDIKVKHDVEVGTVDYFQGHEKDVIILSCVQTKRREGENFLSCPHLFNLAITRAQKLLIICGSAGFLQEWTHWKMFLRYIIRKKVFFRTKSTATNVMLHLTNSGHN